MKTFYCTLALLSVLSLHATKPTQQTKPTAPTPVIPTSVVPTSVVPPKIVLRTHADIEKFTKEEVAKKTMRTFSKAGKNVPTTMSTARRIATLLSTFDSLEAMFTENGKEIKLSDKYREWERKLVDKVIDDKTTYGLENDQIVNMLDSRGDFNDFLQQAIKIIKKQEARR